MELWPNQTIPDVLDWRAQQRGDADAFVIDGCRVTYRHLQEESRRQARKLLAHGISKGSHVAVIMETCPELIYLYQALFRIGAILIPINYNFKAQELDFVLRQSECTHLIFVDQFGDNDYFKYLSGLTDGFVMPKPSAAGEGRFPKLQQFVCLNRSGRTEVRQQSGLVDYELWMAGDDLEQAGNLAAHQASLHPDDCCAMLFTSGSTGFPKLAQIHHRSLVGTGYYYGQHLQLDQSSRILAFFTLYHMGGLAFMVMGSLYAGGCFYTNKFFEPDDVLALIQNEGITTISFFDTHVVKLMNSPRFATTDFSHLHTALFGGPPSTYDLLHRELGVPLVTPNYGSTESGASIALVPADVTDVKVRKNSNGKPFPGISVKIVDPDSGKEQPPGQTGEICTKGWSVFKGYYGMPDENAAVFDAAGYFHSGDIGYLDENGYIYYTGRFKMMVKSGGENVSEIEVENYLCDYLPGVLAARVVGVPDAEWGEAVTAFIELEPGAKQWSLSELRSLCKQFMANFKVPRHVFYVEAGRWPVNTSGKIVKADLRQRAMIDLGLSD